MTEPTPPSTEAQLALASYDRMLAETRKFTAEQTKLAAEQSKLAAEQNKLAAERNKLFAEALKFNRDPWLLIAGALIAGLAAIVARLPEILTALSSAHAPPH